MTTPTTLPRVFIYQGQEYADPDSEMSNEQVRDALARTFGALRNGKIEEEEKDGRKVVTFTTAPKTKG